VYPASQWLVSVERGVDKNAAESAALNALAQTFKVDIQGVTKANQVLINKLEQSKGKEKSETLQLSNLSQETVAISQVSGLIGIERDIWTDSRDGVVYACVRMNRKESVARYTALIKENEALIETLKTTAANIPGTFEAYENLAFAAGIAELTDNFFIILSVLQPSSTNLYPAYGSVNAIRSLANEAVSLIVIDVTVSGDVDNRISKAFASVFSAKNFKTTVITNKSLNNHYTLKADFKLEDVPFADSKFQYTRYLLTGSVMNQDGTEIGGLSETDREGHTIQREARERAILNVERVITEGTFAQKFDAYLDSL
jgi:hypothetical protein